MTFVLNRKPHGKSEACFADSEGEADAGHQGVGILLARNVGVGGVIAQVGFDIPGQGVAEAGVPPRVIEAVVLFAPADGRRAGELVGEVPADSGLDPGPGLGRADATYS